MITVIAEDHIKKARKDHRCSACEFMRENLSEIGSGRIAFSELRAVARAKKSNYKILKGEPYIRQRNVLDGDIYTFKAIPEIHDICLKYELYPED